MLEVLIIIAIILAILLLPNLFPKSNNHLDQICPHCGYYCTGKSVFCTPPLDNNN